MDLEKTFVEMVRRRGDNQYTKFESVPMSTLLTFGLAEGFGVLPAEAGAFYFIANLRLETVVAQTIANVRLEGSNYGGGSAGAVILLTEAAIGGVKEYRDIECDSLLYRINGNTAGSIVATGRVYKITYKAD